MRDPDMARLERCARNAARHCFTTFLPADERMEIALGAVFAEWVATVHDGAEPTDAALYTAGVAAISAETDAWRRVHGLCDNARAHAVYWRDDLLRDATPRPDSPVPGIALRQVLAALSDTDREALMALAMLGSMQAVADHLDITYSAAQQRIRAARVRAYRLWFDWEPAPTPTFDRRLNKPLPTHCGRGHEFTPENTRWRKATSGRGRKRACRACDRAAAEAITGGAA